MWATMNSASRRGVPVSSSSCLIVTLTWCACSSSRSTLIICSESAPRSKKFASPTIADVDNDGRQEVVVAANSSVFIYSADGTLLDSGGMATNDPLTAAPTVASVGGRTHVYILGATRPAAAAGSLTSGILPFVDADQVPAVPQSSPLRIFTAPTAPMPAVLPQPGDTTLPPEQVTAALARMAPAQREVLVLLQVAELSEDQVADVLERRVDSGPVLADADVRLALEAIPVTPPGAPGTSAHVRPKSDETSLPA